MDERRSHGVLTTTRLSRPFRSIHSSNADCPNNVQIVVCLYPSPKQANFSPFPLVIQRVTRPLQAPVIHLIIWACTAPTQIWHPTDAHWRSVCIAPRDPAYSNSETERHCILSDRWRTVLYRERGTAKLRASVRCQSLRSIQSKLSPGKVPYQDRSTGCH